MKPCHVLNMFLTFLAFEAFCFYMVCSYKNPLSHYLIDAKINLIPFDHYSTLTG